MNINEYLSLLGYGKRGIQNTKIQFHNCFSIPPNISFSQKLYNFISLLNLYISLFLSVSLSLNLYLYFSLFYPSIFLSQFSVYIFLSLFALYLSLSLLPLYLSLFHHFEFKQKILTK